MPEIGSPPVSETPTAPHPWELFRDATFSQETRGALLIVEQLTLAAIDAGLQPQYLSDEKADALRCLRDVMDRWDANDATECTF